MMDDWQTLFRLEPPIRTYDWGSHDFLARIRGAAFPTVDRCAVAGRGGIFGASGFTVLVLTFA